MRNNCTNKFKIFLFLLIISFITFSLTETPLSQIHNEGTKAIQLVARSLITSQQNDTINHVIITTDDFAEEFQRLADWRTQKGLKCSVVIVDSIYEEYDTLTGDTTKIRQFIIDKSNEWGTEYFLLGGEHSDIPINVRHINNPETSDNSDQYYGDYDDDWQYDVYVGRYSCEDTTQVKRVIDKILYYERDIPLDSTSYFDNFLFFGMDIPCSTHTGKDLSEYIIDSIITGTYDITEIYDIPDTSDHEDDFKNHLKSGNNIVNHIDDGVIGGGCFGTGSLCHNSRFLKADFDSIYQDYKYLNVLIVPGCCRTIDFGDPDTSFRIGEYLVMEYDMAGPVAYLGSSTIGTQYQRTIDSLIWRQIFSDSNSIENDYHIGVLLSKAKNNCNVTDEDPVFFKLGHWGFNLLGDPAMPIWTDTPESLCVTIPDTFFTHKQCIILVEDSESAAVESSYVCLMKPDGLYYRDYTDYKGRLIFDDFPEVSAGSLSVCATKHNYLPSISYGTAIDSLFSSLEGRVVDTSGTAVESVYVSVKIDASNKRYGWTDEYGCFDIDSIYVDSLQETYEVVFFDRYDWRKDTTVTFAYWQTKDIGTVAFDFSDSCSCSYVPGDANGDESFILGDYTYLVNYLLYGGDPPPDSCWNYPDHSWLYSAADATGDCIVILGDASRILQYFMMQGDPPDICEYTPTE